MEIWTLTEGTTRWSKYRADPPLHILHEMPNGGYRTWCTGAPAVRASTANRRRCTKCTQMLTQLLGGGDSEGQRVLDDWLVSTQPARTG